MECFSKNAIAGMVNVDRRTLDKYLDTPDFPPDDMAGSQKRWNMRSVCAALSPLLAKATTNKSTDDIDKLEPIDQKHHYDAQIKKNQLKEIEGELVPVGEVRETIAGTFKELSLGLDIIPDRIELKCGLSPDQIAAMIGIIDECKENLANSLIDYINE